MYPYNNLRSNNMYYQNGEYNNDERFFWAPFVVGGLAGTALGYGIANNNELNNHMYYQPYPYYYPYPTYIYPTQNTYYY